MHGDASRAAEALIADRMRSVSSTSSIRFQLAMPRWIMFVTQPKAIIGHASIASHELNATNCPDRDAAGDHFAAAEPEHEHRARDRGKGPCSGRRIPGA